MLTLGWSSAGWTTSWVSDWSPGVEVATLASSWNSAGETTSWVLAGALEIMIMALYLSHIYISHHAKKLVKAQGKAIIATIFAHLGQNG